MSPEEKLKELGIELPDAPAPLGSYIPAIRTGNLIFISGMLPLKDGILLHKGKVGDDVTLENAQEASRRATINALSVLRSAIGNLDKVKRCVKITGYIASSPAFIDHPNVLNTASDFIYEIFGEIGRHARAAVGVNVLPQNSTIEIEFIFEVL